MQRVHNFLRGGQEKYELLLRIICKNIFSREEIQDVQLAPPMVSSVSAPGYRYETDVMSILCLNVYSIQVYINKWYIH